MRPGGPWTHQAAAAPSQHPVPLGWKSPVPYLFGGLAAMLGLISFALLILACSYWKLSGYQDHPDHSGDSAGDKPAEGREKGMMDNVVGNSVLVIMAGDHKPTFLATTTTLASSFGDESEVSSSCSCNCGKNGDEGEKMGGGDGGGCDSGEREVSVTITDS